MASFREASKKDWLSANNAEHINVGSLQRIADACELMGKNYTEILKQRDQYHDWYGLANKENDSLRRKIKRLEKLISELKNKPNEPAT